MGCHKIRETRTNRSQVTSLLYTTRCSSCSHKLFASTHFNGYLTATYVSHTSTERIRSNSAHPHLRPLRTDNQEFRHRLAAMPFEAIDRFERVRHRNRYCIPSVATALQIIAILILVLTIALSSWSAPQKWQKQQHVSRIEAISANDLASISDVSKVAVPLEPERAVSQQNSTYPILSTLHRYRRRAVSEEAWGKKVKRGTDLDCAFGMPLSAVAQSPWLRWSSLAEWGWEDESHKSMYIEMEMEGISDLAPTLDAFHRYHNYDTAFLTGKWQDSNMGHGKEYIWPGTDRHEHVRGFETCV